MLITKDSVKVVRWEGAVGIERAGALRQDLLDALGSHSSVDLDLSLVEKVDTAALQLIRAAYLEASRRGRVFRVTGTIQPGLMRLLTLSGFVTRVSPNAQDLEDELSGRDGRGEERRE